MKPILLLLLFAFSSHAQPSSELNLLKELVSTSSGTADPSGVNQVQDKISSRLKSLGFLVSLIENPNSNLKSGKMLVATYAGKNPQFITLVGHADTVFEKLNPFSISADGKIAKGSGVSDNKGGLVVGLSALERYLKLGQPFYSLRFIVSPSEETGSNGFADLFRQYSKDSVFVIGLEPARENANIVTARKGVRWYEITATGREAHAGVDHDYGINACDEIALKAHQLQSLTNYQTGTTVNIGRMEGGKDKFNIVCGTAKVKIDVRYSTPTAGKKLFAEFEHILNQPVTQSAKTKEKVKLQIWSDVDTPPYATEASTTPLLNKYIAIIKKIEGKSIIGEKTGGVGDLNFFSRPGLRMLDGMGPIGGGYHTADEFVDMQSLNTRSQALAELLSLIN